MMPLTVFKRILIVTAVAKLFTLAAAADAVRGLKPVYSEYTRTQVIDWIDDQNFAVGRWDGSLSIFRLPRAGENTPVLVQVRAAAVDSGVEMVAALDSRSIIFSEGSDAIAMWIKGSTTLFEHYERIAHDSTLGIANSAALVADASPPLLVTGHANGFAEVWEWNGSTLRPVRSIDLRSPLPIPSQFPLKNIRGLVSWKNGLMISASEDGDVTAFRPASGEIVFRQRFNPSAQLGINNISLVGDTLLLANCSVGSNDKNLWLYDVSVSCPRFRGHMLKLIASSPRSRLG